MYTVVCDYDAQGEGRTLSLWMGPAQSEQDARDIFARAVYGGVWFVKGAKVFTGLAFDHEIARMLLTDTARDKLTDPNCMSSFSSQLHYNYS